MTYTALREALIEIRAAVDDPMWANHSEVSKNALKRWSKAIVAHLAQQPDMSRDEKLEFGHYVSDCVAMVLTGKPQHGASTAAQMKQMLSDFEASQKKGA